MAAVEVVGLTKRFGETVALRGLDLDVPEGSVLGVLGPNGAGKTTVVRILTTLIRPDAGRAFVDGIDVLAEPRRVRARIGLTGQYAAVDERLTGRENLELVGRYYHLGGREARRRTVDLLERFDLTDAADRLVKGYSGGMRRRLDIAMSLIARPSVLFLDEPTTGLDPRSRLAMWELIADLTRDRDDDLPDHPVPRRGRPARRRDRGDRPRVVIARDTSDALKRRVGGERVTVEVADAATTEAAAAALAPIAAGEPQVEPTTHRVTVPVAEADGAVPAAVRALDAAGVDIVDVGLRRPTLDDVFLALTGHAAAPDEAAAGSPDLEGADR